MPTSSRAALLEDAVCKVNYLPINKLLFSVSGMFVIPPQVESEGLNNQDGQRSPIILKFNKNQVEGGRDVGDIVNSIIETFGLKKVSDITSEDKAGGEVGQCMGTAIGDERFIVVNPSAFDAIIKKNVAPTSPDSIGDLTVRGISRLSSHASSVSSVPDAERSPSR